MKGSKLLLFTVLAVPFLAGCSKKAASGVTITIWEDASNVQVVETLCKRFIAQYKQTYHNVPDISVKIIEQREGSAIERMQEIASTGKGPDIAAVTHNTIATGVTSELLAEATFSSQLKERMSPEAINAVSVTERIGSVDVNRIYGYPITAESQVVMYDDRLISAEQLVSFEALKTSTKKLGLALKGDMVGYYTWGLYTDSVLFGADGKTASEVNIGTPNSVTNVTNFYNTYVKASNTVFENCEPETALNHVNSGRIAGFISSPYMLSELRNAIGTHAKIAPLPKLGDVTLSPFSGYKAYVVSRYSPNGALAHELCDYLTSVDANLYRLQQKGYLPAVPFDSSAEIQQAINNNEYAKVFQQSFVNSRVMPNIAKIESLWRPMNTACSTLFDESANSGLTEARVKQILDVATQSLIQG